MIEIGTYYIGIIRSFENHFIFSELAPLGACVEVDCKNIKATKMQSNIVVLCTIILRSSSFLVMTHSYKKNPSFYDSLNL